MTMHAITQNSGFFGSIGRAWNRYRKRRAAMSELQSLGGAELERIVRDAGLSSGDVVELARQSGDSAALLCRRLGEEGIDARAVESPVVRDMERCCSLCDSKARCASDLERQTKAANWPDYCPNQLTLEALGAAKCH